MDVVCGDGRRHFRADVSCVNLFLVPVNFSDNIFHSPLMSLLGKNGLLSREDNYSENRSITKYYIID